MIDESRTSVCHGFAVRFLAHLEAVAQNACGERRPDHSSSGPTISHPARAFHFRSPLFASVESVEFISCAKARLSVYVARGGNGRLLMYGNGCRRRPRLAAVGGRRGQDRSAARRSLTAVDER